MMIKRSLPLLILTFAIVFGFSRSAVPQPLASGIHKQMRAIHVKSPSPSVDGRLDDAAWQYAEFVSDFLQKEPNQGTVPAESSRVAVVYDDDALYIGARMYSQRPDLIRTDLDRRDNQGNAEQMILSLDTYHDHRTSYDFGVTAAGGRFDRYHPVDVEHETDFSFDPVWEAAASVDSLGWCAEMRIPFSQLRFNAAAQQTWGINWNRWIPARNEDNFWIYTPRNESGWASRFGELVGIENVKPSRRLELLPYITGNGQFDDEPQEGNPFNNGHELKSNVGGDLKMGLGPNLTLDATINPDFGQVEADPAVVNLSAYETQYTERRPFFTEGNKLLQTQGPTYFYSRRVGGAPHGPRPDDNFVDFPGTTTILGAGKVSGRLPSGTSIGFLTAVTDREIARSCDSASQPVSRTLVEPRAGYAVARVLQEFGKSKSTVGLVLTGVTRDLNAHDALSGSLRKNAITGGTDWRWRINGGEYELDGYAGFSHVSGERGAILATQKSSARYFQRPDISYVHLDSNRTSLSGYATSVTINKRNAVHWLWGAKLSFDSPGFEINDAGYKQNADRISQIVAIAYRDNEPGPVFRSYSFRLEGDNTWNYGGVKQYNAFNFSGEMTLKNYWSLRFGEETSFRAQSDNVTRGGPSMGIPMSWNAWAYVGNNYSAPLQYGLNAWVARSELGGWEYGFDPNCRARPGTRWGFSVAPHYVRGATTRQYVGTDTTGHPAITYGTRYIFSGLGYSTLSAQFRVNYFFTPNMSLEAYVEPFASSGRYYNFGEMRAPRDMGLRNYGADGTTITKKEDGSYEVTDGAYTLSIPNQDYGYLSYRSNVVLRWEFHPGSTVYLVWQQNRTGDKYPGRSVRPGSLWDAWQSKGANFLALKFSYWWAVS